MEPDRKAVEMYKEEALNKISLIQTDTQTYEYRIKQNKKEIENLNWLISQYDTFLEGK